MIVDVSAPPRSVSHLPRTSSGTRPTACDVDSRTAVADMTESRFQGLGPHGPSVHEVVVSAAKAHAACIRHTLRAKEYRRANGRPPALPATASKRTRGAKLRDCSNGEPPTILEGPIYSAEYWRTWQNRSKSRARGFRDSNDGEHGSTEIANTAIRQGKHRSFRVGDPVEERGERRVLSASRAARRPSQQSASFARAAPPTSSFAGGRPGTLIFASLPGSDSLLQAHHDAVIKPLSDGSPSQAAASSKCSGIRLSNSEPRPKAHSGNQVTDGVYYIDKADRLVLPTAIGCQFREGTSSSYAGNAIQGLSRDTPGAIYNPLVGGSNAQAPTTRLSSAERFPSESKTFVFPGPGHYNPEASSMGHLGARGVAWTGAETFGESKWSRPARLPRLRSWEGFGHGCSLQEHIDYGACLDGRCCTRHSVERRNALHMVQFLGKRGRCMHGSRGRRHRSHHDGRGNAKRHSPQPASHPLENDSSDDFDSKIEQHDGDAKPSSARPKSAPWSGARSDATGVVKVGKVTHTRTPLHFASERAELSLVDRLCTQGDDRNAVNERGQTPLHVAAEKGITRVVERLLRGNEEEEGMPVAAAAAAPHRRKRGIADVNIQDSNGRTALYLACLRGHERVVRVLLEAGADPDLVDIRGKPPQQVAGQQKIYQLLQFKADVSLLKANIAALEEEQRCEERKSREAARATAKEGLAELKREEKRLRAKVEALERKRGDYVLERKRGEYADLKLTRKKKHFGGGW